MENRTLDPAEKPYKVVSEDKPDIPRKPKAAVPLETNGESKTNGTAEPKRLKRSNEDGEEQPSKKAKIGTGTPEDNDVVLVEEAGGAIVIDD